MLQQQMHLGNYKTILYREFANNLKLYGSIFGVLPLNFYQNLYSIKFFVCPNEKYSTFFYNIAFQNLELKI